MNFRASSSVIPQHTKLPSGKMKTSPSLPQALALHGTFIPAVMDVDVQAEPAKVWFPDWTN
ncbi:hypothetical protein PISMIDRAFT_15418 [Pisolithus microcarpus 441]|uniref:Uncharacterized protein n=1 Tax=Pisolithus microcarpus 441 TaxID=765257 RepID=A0A0C9XX31_9AGAM|nr:hypothetical protein PISMIDRAFT_15418 [Pisolithus microcarpus 441]